MTTSSPPTVSVVLPVYNEERFLAGTLDAILSQTYGDFELILSDNASTDRTPDILHQYARKDPRVRLLRNDTNIGALKNFNQALTHARGQFVWIAGGHDSWDANFLEACLKRYEELPEALLVYAEGYWLEEDGTRGASLGGGLDLTDPNRWTRFFQSVKGLECYPVYSVFRKEALNRGCMAPCILLPDMVILSELAIRGMIGYVPETTFYLRLLSDSFGLPKAIQRIVSLDQRLGKKLVFDLCFDVFRYYFQLIRKYESSRRRRFRFKIRVTAMIWRRWWRMLIQTIMIEWCPDVLNEIRNVFRKRPLGAADETKP
jgi:glycosyltransferase involved in cell wall biosynthesis